MSGPGPLRPFRYSAPVVKAALLEALLDTLAFIGIVVLLAFAILMLGLALSAFIA